MNAGLSPVPESDWDDDSAGPESDEVEAPVEAPAESSFGEDDEKSTSHGPSGGRHGRRRGEERDSVPRERAQVTFDEDDDQFDSVETTSAGAGEPESDADSSAEDDGDDESGEHVVNYENVPTWEEAISYLLHPSQVQVESGTGGGASPRGNASADQPRQTRHIGHRKHRR